MLAYNAPYAVVYMLNKLMKNSDKVIERVKLMAQKPMSKRAPFENFTYGLASTGVVTHPHFCHFVERFSSHTKSQVIFFCITSLNGYMDIQVCAQQNLYDMDQVFAVCDQLYDSLTNL